MGVHAYSSGLGVIRVCWIIFIVVWLLGAVSTKRTIYRESSAERARYWLVLVIGYFLVVKSSSLPPPFDWLIVPHTKLSAWVGAFLCVSGLVFAIWARVILGRNWSGVITLKEGHELIERGPYRVVRHPIYTGILAMFAGTAIAIGLFRRILRLVARVREFLAETQTRRRFDAKTFSGQIRRLSAQSEAHYSVSRLATLHRIASVSLMFCEMSNCAAS